jgi:glutathione reductase (NADPH)
MTCYGRLFGGQTDAHADYEGVPTVVFSHPPIGTCGLTEAAAAEKFGQENVKAYCSTFTNMYYGTFTGERAQSLPKTAMKLVTTGPEEKVVGIHMIGACVSAALWCCCVLRYFELFEDQSMCQFMIVIVLILFHCFT